MLPLLQLACGIHANEEAPTLETPTLEREQGVSNSEMWGYPTSEIVCWTISHLGIQAVGLSGPRAVGAWQLSGKRCDFTASGRPPLQRARSSEFRLAHPLAPLLARK